MASRLVEVAVNCLLLLVLDEVGERGLPASSAFFGGQGGGEGAQVETAACENGTNEAWSQSLHGLNSIFPTDWFGKGHYK